MLAHNGTRVDANDVVARESLSHKLKSTCVVGLLIVCRHDYSTIKNEEVGVCSRQSVVLVVYGVGHRKLKQSVRIAVGIGSLLQLKLKSLEVGKLRVALVVASHI